MGKFMLSVIGIFIAAAPVAADDSASAREKPDSAPSATADGKQSRAAPLDARDLKSVRQVGSYAAGFNLGIDLRRQYGPEALDFAAFILGVQEAIARKKPALSGFEREQAIKKFQRLLVDERDKNMATIAKANKRKGEEFLASNKKEKGVVVLPSGAQYVVLKEGTGKRPTLGDTVNVDYHGTLIDGTVFDSSVKRGEPIGVQLGKGIIAGWTEVLQLMKVGSKWRVFVPSDLAYGRDGRPPSIQANEVLIFEIELLSIEE